MNKEVTNQDILRAITELSDDLKETKIELKVDVRETHQKIDATEKRLSDKIELIDQKFMLTNDDLRTAQAEIKVLQRGVN